jgi:arginase
METLINFSGISFEIGQSKKGLALSTKNARSYFPLFKNMGVSFIDHDDIYQNDFNSQVKIFSETDLVKIDWVKYKHTYIKTLGLLKNKTPLLNWGGDHSISISTVGAFSYQYPDGYVLWIDAHADLNLPEKSFTGNLHGMPLAVLLNLNGIAGNHFKWLKKTLDPKKLIYLGLRDVDPFELNIIKELNIKSFFYQDVLKFGIQSIAKKILDITRDHPLHISFDIDSIDPNFAPSTGVPVRNGLTPTDLITLGAKLSQNSIIRSIDVVEINPTLGSSIQVDQTYLTAFTFLKSVFLNNNFQGEIYDGMGERNQRKYSSQMEWCL